MGTSEFKGWVHFYEIVWVHFSENRILENWSISTKLSYCLSALPFTMYQPCNSYSLLINCHPSHRENVHFTACRLFEKFSLPLWTAKKQPKLAQNGHKMTFFAQSRVAFFTGSRYNHVWDVKWSLWVTSTRTSKGFRKFGFYPTFGGHSSFFSRGLFFWKHMQSCLGCQMVTMGHFYTHVFIM